MRWTGEPREFLIDLAGVATREQFQREMARHFDVPDDHRELWGSLARAILYQTGPYRIRFGGWPGFEQQMPRYARRLRRLIEGHQSAHGEERLAAEFDGQFVAADPGHAA
ncbi:MAG: hypothetical protein U0800_00605 [Isosphaeraceae bacterium]